jgi:hypothetical protein
MAPNRPAILVSVVLAAMTLAALGSVCANDFINVDDPDYVTENLHVQRGLTRDSIAWAWTDFSRGHQWVPLTRLSFLVDHECHGLNPAGYHLTNLLLHVGNVVVLFWVLRQLTGALWRSALVAAFFAVHPLRVESVAWIAERKDVLSTFFGLLALGAYARYARRPSMGRYLAVVLLFTLSLLAKPMLVTLPFLLLLLDYWPLGRLLPARSQDAASEDAGVPWWQLLGEKLPLLGIAAAFAVVTFAVHRDTPAMSQGDSLPLLYRGVNALVACSRYLDMTFWPSGLSIWYPYSARFLSQGHVVKVGVFLLVISLAILAWGRGRRYLAVGWLWFLGTLLPVLGLVSFTGSALADRYTYVPHIGLLVLLTWSMADLLAAWGCRPIFWLPVAGSLLVACMVCTVRQAEHWRNSRTLWEHAVAVTPEHAEAHEVLGRVLYRAGRQAEAEAHLMEAVRINPDWLPPLLALAKMHYQSGAWETAESDCRMALRLDPRNSEAQLLLTLVRDRR